MKHLRLLLLFTVLSAVSLVHTGCAHSDNVGSYNHDTYSDEGGGKASLANLSSLGLEILPVRWKLRTDGHDHGITAARTMLAKDKLSDFKADIKTHEHGVDRSWGIGLKESSPDADAIRALNENPVFKGLSEGLQTWISGGLASLWRSDQPDDVKLSRSIDAAQEDPEAPDGAVEELQAKLQDLTGEG